MDEKPIRVLQIGMTRNIGGLETYLMQQFDHLDLSKVIYDFVNITGEYDIVFHQHILDKGGRVFSVKSRHSNPIRHYWQWLKLLHHISSDYKAIVLNSNALTYVFPIFAAHFFGIPIRVMHSHNSGFEQEIGLGKKAVIAMNRLLLKFGATHYFACSRLAGRWMFGDDTEFTVIPNAIDLNKYRYNPDKRQCVRTKLGIEQNFVIGHVGRFTYQKNHEFLIDIFNEIVKYDDTALLLLIGGPAGDDTFLKKAREKVQTYGLQDKVRFLGMRNDVPDLYQAMDCFVLPSHFEGLCIAAVEAQATGVQCYCSNALPGETNLSSNYHTLPLDAGAEKWAREILASKAQKRIDRSTDIRQAGYDIQTEAERIEMFYYTS